MPKLQIIIPKEVDKLLKIYKIEHNFIRKSDAIIDILKKFFKGRYFK